MGSMGHASQCSQFSISYGAFCGRTRYRTTDMQENTICGQGYVTRALAPAQFTQPSPRIFLHFCKLNVNAHLVTARGGILAMMVLVMAALVVPVHLSRIHVVSLWG